MDETSFQQTLCRACSMPRPGAGKCPTCGLDIDASMGGSEWNVPVPDGYRILAKVGEGGMGAVFKAHDHRLDRVVALKYLTVTRKELVSRFVKEGQILARLVHPGIIRVYGYEVLGEAPVLICEFVEGESLADVLNREGKFLPARALKFMRLCLEALSAAHEMDVIHRDLKLENLLVTGDEELKLADFGVASCRDVSSGGTGSGIIVGTPSYMAPEQAMGQTVDPRADIYSVGVMLFELLTGRLPFEDPNPMKVLEMQVKKKPILVNRLDPAIGLELTALVARCLEKEPAKRFASAEELSQALSDPDLVRSARRATSRLRVAEGTGRQDPKSLAMMTSESMTAIPIPRREDLVEPVMPPAERRWKSGAAATGAVLVLFLVALIGKQFSGVPIVTLNVEAMATGWMEGNAEFRVPATPPVPGQFLASSGQEEAFLPARIDEGVLAAHIPPVFWKGCTLRFVPASPGLEVSPASIPYEGIHTQLVEEIGRLFIKPGMLTAPRTSSATVIGVERRLEALRGNVASGFEAAKLTKLMNNHARQDIKYLPARNDLSYFWNQVVKVAPLVIRLAPRFAADRGMSEEDRRQMQDVHHLVRLFGRLVAMHGLLETAEFMELAGLLTPPPPPEGDPAVVFRKDARHQINLPGVDREAAQSAMFIGETAGISGAEKGNEYVSELRVLLERTGGGSPGKVIAAQLVIEMDTLYLQNSMGPADLLWVTLNGKRALMVDHACVQGNRISVPVDPSIVSLDKNSLYLVREAVGDWEEGDTAGRPVELTIGTKWFELRIWTVPAQAE